MNWVRGFNLNMGAPPVRNVEDAPAAMRQEFVDLVFGLAEQNPHAVMEERLYRISLQSLGFHVAGQPHAGFRHAVGRDLRQVEWNRVYDLIVRLGPEFNAAGLAGQYREGLNRILAAYGCAWDLSEQGRLERVLPVAAQAMVAAVFVELNNPAYAPALQLLNAARDDYDDRPRRDRDVCSNIFDAMESVAKIKYQRPNDTFGNVKKHIEANNLLRAEVIAMLTGLNQLRNGNFGHGMAVPFNLTPAETDFVYLTCISTILLLTRTP